MVLQEIAIAVVGAMPPTAAALAALWKSMRAEQHTRPNGGGSLSEMQERLLDGMSDLRGEVGYLGSRLEAHERDPTGHGGMAVRRPNGSVKDLRRREVDEVPQVPPAA